MSEKIKKIRVTVSYYVGIGEINIDKKTHSELKELFENGVTMISGTSSELDYPNAADWLQNKIRERDCYAWECEIDELK